jgi:hypothetical protein
MPSAIVDFSLPAAQSSTLRAEAEAACERYGRSRSNARFPGVARGRRGAFFYSINGRWFYQQREKTRSQVTRNRVAGSRTLKKATLSTLSNSRFWFSVVRASVETHV